MNTQSSDHTPPRYLWEPYVEFGKATVFLGRGGSGKTMLAGAIAASASHGLRLGGRPVYKTNVDLASTQPASGSDIFRAYDTHEDHRKHVGTFCFKCFPKGAATREVVWMLQECQQLDIKGLFVFDPIDLILADWDHPQSAIDFAALAADTGQAIILTANSKTSSLAGIPAALGLGINLFHLEQANNDWKSIYAYRGSLPPRRFRIGTSGLVEFHPDDWGQESVA